MLRNYVKVAWRNILRYRGHSLINITGLAVSLMFCILAVIFVRHEYSFDKFHDNAERIHLLYHQTGNGERKPSGSTPPILAPTIADAVPGIDRIARVYGWDLMEGAPVRAGDQTIMMQGFYVDPDFLRIFSFPHISGEREAALSDPSSIIITASMAKQMFGDRDPLGREVRIRLRKGEVPFYVRRVIDLPKSSSIRFDFLIHYQHYGEWSRKWNSNNVYTFVLLERDMSPKDMEARLLAFFEGYFQSGSTSGRSHFGAEDHPVKLLGLTEMYLNTEIREWLTVQSDPASSSILLGIALAVLLTACVNFVNLSLGLSSRRAKEAGMRKVVGARRSQIIRQYLIESWFITFIAMAAGLLLAALVLPAFAQLMDRDLSFEPAGLILPLLVITVTVGAAAGIYPALAVSRFEPHAVLKRKTALKFKSPLGNALLILQFGLSIGLIVAALTMVNQMRHMRAKDLGFDPQQIVVIDGGGRWVGLDEQAMRRILSVYRKSVDQRPEIISATMASILFSAENLWGTGLEANGRDISVKMYAIDYDYLQTTGARLVAGREFSRDFPGDARNAVMVNQRMVEAMGWNEPIGKNLPPDREDLRGQVIGVIEDMHLQSLHHEIEPAVFHLESRNGFYRYILVRADTEDWRGVLAHLRSVWEDAAPGQPFLFSFLDDRVDRIFREDQRWADLASYASLFAVLIACMGAFGLISLALARRTKEIGIRKVLGAGEGSILHLMAKDFLILLAAAAAMAWPLTYFFLRGWLRNFAYRVELGLWPFFLGTMITVTVISASIGFKILKTARTNPADALRYE
jgi:putative ABC transport system permease protein